MLAFARRRLKSNAWPRARARVCISTRARIGFQPAAAALLSIYTLSDSSRAGVRESRVRKKPLLQRVRETVNHTRMCIYMCEGRINAQARHCIVHE